MFKCFLLLKMVQQSIRNGCVVSLQLRRPELGRDGRPGEHPAMAGEDGPSFCLTSRCINIWQSWTQFHKSNMSKPDRYSPVFLFVHQDLSDPIPFQHLHNRCEWVHRNLSFRMMKLPREAGKLNHHGTGYPSWIFPHQSFLWCQISHLPGHVSTESSNI